MTYLLLLLGLVALYQGGEWAVSGCVHLSHRLKLSTAFIAAVIIGFGTSVPEFAASFVAAWRGNDGIAVGNVIGSNIANILLVYALGMAIVPFHVRGSRYIATSLLVMAVSFLLLLFAVLQGEVGIGLAVVMLAVFAAYIIYSLKSGKQTPPDSVDETPIAAVLIVIRALGGIVLLVVGAHLAVENAALVATRFAVPESMIAVSVIALGTSLPEVAATVAAMRMKMGAIIVGNVIGSSIFNVLAVLGLTRLFAPLRIEANLAGFDIWVMLIAGVVCTFYAMHKAPRRFYGAIGLAGYAAYLGFTFTRLSF